MSKFEYAISDELSDDERNVVAAKRTACFEACPGVSLRWSLTTDHKDRRFLRLTDYSRPNICYFEAPAQDIERTDDLRFKNAIINNERPCSNDTTQ